MDDQANVRIHPHRPEVFVATVELVELQSRIRHVHLEVEGSHLDCLLFIASQSTEAGGKGIGNSEIHVLRRDWEHYSIVKFLCVTTQESSTAPASSQ